LSKLDSVLADWDSGHEHPRIGHSHGDWCASRRIARHIIFETLALVPAEALTGLALGMTSVLYIESLFYQVKGTVPSAVVVPSLVPFAAALVAAVPPLIRAMRIDPVTVLRSE
jgi:hypothetical protein